ncbi:MAG TPA: 23S rRNA (adenine(2030)-N(6))-methyltransferase RlmJ [Azospirillaceae bacterium]|nr:23S rRNA (adenine(2030)-N(6))-methyltransferase RlmJ [Azospirillaceae bacterium]
MNYRHIYHAGNFADVLKHTVLALLLEHLRRKDTPFVVLDTHAGIGRYDLSSIEAGKTREYESGIARLLAAPDLPPELAPYLDVVRALNPEAGPLRWYPGSPRVARSLMRPSDRLILAELHPEDAVTLKREFRGDRQVAVHHQDAYQSLKAHLPPKEKRSLVLVDPPFETPDEFARMVAGLKAAHKRWPTGQYALWYPIKERALIWRFHQALEDAAIPKTLAVELTILPEDDPFRLSGCGMILVNPPWQLDITLGRVLPALHRALGAPAGGGRVEWIVPDPSSRQ